MTPIGIEETEKQCQKLSVVQKHFKYAKPFDWIS